MTDVAVLPRRSTWKPTIDRLMAKANHGIERLLGMAGTPVIYPSSSARRECRECKRLRSAEFDARRRAANFVD